MTSLPFLKYTEDGSEIVKVFMLHNLYKSQQSPAIRLIKNWLNILVTPNPNLSAGEFYDEKMMLAVRRFQIQNGSPNPHGIIDDETLYNILVRTNSKQIDYASSRNPAFTMLVSSMTMAYDDEVHRNLTYALALAAGFHFPNAAYIAGTNVGVDYNADTQPLPTGATDVYDNYERLRDWHFVTPERLKELDNKWRGSGSLDDLGMYMHTFQDSFSHRDLGPKLGQVGTRVDENGVVHRDSKNKAEWHQVDDPSKRPWLANDMAFQSYNKLVEAVKICSQKDPQKLTIRLTFRPVPWSDIAKEVWGFCNEKDARQREGRADKLAVRLEQNQIRIISGADAKAAGGLSGAAQTPRIGVSKSKKKRRRN